MPSETTLRFSVPDLAERPYIGSLCCVASAYDLIAEELISCPGVKDARVDPRRGVVEVDVGPRGASVADLLDSLAALGYPASLVVGGSSRCL